jgi:CheY-like chemotaxis protein
MFQEVADFQHLDLTVTTSAEAAYDYLSRAVPDVIVMDVFMPGIDGYQAFRHIRQNALAANRPIVAITAYYTSDTEQDVLAWGFNGFVAKPFEPTKLIPYLESVVRSQQVN